MQKPQLILSDVDGTLVRNGPLIQPAIPAILEEVRAAGVHVAMVTGRGYAEIIDIIKMLGITGPSVFDGGSSIIDCASGEELWSQKIDTGLTAQIVQEISKHTQIINWGLGETVPDSIHTKNIHYAAPSVWAPLSYDVAVQLAGMYNSHPELSAYISDGMGEYTGLTNIQVTHKNADKYHGVVALLHILGVDKTHTLAIGDGDNDIPLFRAAAVKIAMGNASEALLAAADHVTDSIDDDGFATAMKRFVL